MFRHKTFEDLLEIALYECKRKKFDRMEQIWQEIQTKYPTTETEILHAIFLTLGNHPKYIQAWKNIVDKHKDKLEEVGKSRNQVREIRTRRSLLIIKTAEHLRQEFDVLRQIYTQLPPEERISVVPLSIYTEEDLDYLITLRKDSPNINSILESLTIEQRIETATKAISQLQKLNSLNITNIQPYNLMGEFQRRLIKRIPTQEPTRLLYAYERFKNKFSPRLLPVHGDAYPTNVLADGTILDLETISLCDPWLDLEAFITHPLLISHEKEILSGFNLDPINRELFEAHVRLCQIGSFSTKSPTTSRFFYELALDRLQALGEKELLEATKEYLEPTISSL